MVRMFDSQMHIEVWPKLDYASTLFTYMTSLMSLENQSVKQKEFTRIVFYKFSILCSVSASSTSYFSPSFHVEPTTPRGFVSFITHHVYLSPPWKVLEILATLASSHENVFRQSLVRRKYRYERRTECFSLINRQFEEFSKKQGLVQLN